MIPALGTRLEQTHKAREGFELNLFTYVAINPDRRQAIADARGTVAFYASIGQYEKYGSLGYLSQTGSGSSPA